jgi:hypothetical protein
MSNNAAAHSAFCDWKRAGDTTRYQALRTLANRLVGILHGCLRTQTLYDEQLAWHTESDEHSPEA